MEVATDQLLLLHHEVLETTKAAPAEVAAACEAAAAEAVAVADMPADGGYLAYDLPDSMDGNAINI